jgi:D-tyrosyl-tRNA(Tyr) deacylase
MRLCLQRVKRAHVSVSGETVGRIGKGLLVLLGVGRADTEKEADFFAEKCMGLRIFEDADGKMNLSVKEAGGGVLVVSQFTLYGDVRKGRRPSFTDAAPPEHGNRLYEYFCERIRQGMGHVQKGVFGAMMDVELVNDGPVTIWAEK